MVEIEPEHISLVRFLARRLAARHPSFDFDDLFQEGMLGLLDAAERYDAKNGASFKTFAEFRIKGAMTDFLRAASIVPRSQRVHSLRIARARQSAEQRLGRSASIEEVADEMGASVDFIAEKEHVFEPEHNDLAMERLACADPAIEHMIASESSKGVKEAVAGLPRMQKLCITLSFYGEMTDQQIGEMLGVTESRVCQVVGEALWTLRSRLGSTIDS